MRRKDRIDASGALHHIIVRGTNRRKIFFDDHDRDDFLDRLGGILSESKTPCFVWAFMTNHLHLLRTMRKGASRMKDDERILGQGDFVETILKTAQENLDRKSMIRALGYDFEWLVNRVTGLFGLTVKELLTGGKQRRTVKARSVLCYWGTRELGMSAVGISKKLNIASSTASESVARGRQIVEEQGLKLLEENIE